MSQNERRRSFVGGVTILGISGVISKVIGMLFRVPLGNMIGPGGMAVFSTVYNIYAMLLAISSAGIPVAISRLVSESVTLGNHRRARRTLWTAFWLLAAIGLFLTLLLVAISGPLARGIGAPQTQRGFIAIAPSILLASVMSAFRGYMQGRTRMTPTAVSQVIEQAAKVVISYPLALLGMRTGVVEAANGALLGISIGEGLAMLYMAVSYMVNRKRFLAEERPDEPQPEGAITLLKQIVGIAVPITIGSMIVPLAGSIDTSMTRLRLAAAGIGPDMIETLYGLLSGYVLPLINVPTVLAIAVCIGLVPTISAARIAGRVDDMRETSRLGLRLASLIGFPCAVGMSMLATPIMHFVFPGLAPQDVAIAGDILTISAWTIALFIHVQASTGILQGAGMHKVPVYSLVVGVVCKVILNFFLIGSPAINIYGAPLASIACYLISMTINIVWIVRKAGMRMDWGAVVVRPAIATAGMAAVVWGMEQVLDMQRRTGVLLAILVAVAVYAVLVFVTGALRRDDMAQIPGGTKLEGLLVKLRVWR